MDCGYSLEPTAPLFYRTDGTAILTCIQNQCFDKNKKKYQNFSNDFFFFFNFYSFRKFYILQGHVFVMISAATPEKQQFAQAKPKTQISFAVTAKLISAFDFATRIVQFLYFLNPKFQVSSCLLWLYRPLCVGPGWNAKLLVFLPTDSFIIILTIIMHGPEERP